MSGANCPGVTAQSMRMISGAAAAFPATARTSDAANAAGFVLLMGPPPSLTPPGQDTACAGEHRHAPRHLQRFRSSPRRRMSSTDHGAHELTERALSP